ncbi:N-acetylglucosaminyltransferas-like protein [Halenospora varia]|nr:N-acetylglucosaminyltransferas-like protein [Halenospora varia]
MEGTTTTQTVLPTSIFNTTSHTSEKLSSSSLKQICEKFHLSLHRFSSFVTEWTPFLLVASYYWFSVSLYILFPEKLMAAFWYIYMISNFYIASSTVLEAFMSIEPCREARKVVTKAQDNDWKFPTPDDELLILDLLIVAYLPNEKDIIMDRALYALEQISYPQHLIRINILYNTPYPIEPLESELHELTLRFPHARVIKVPGSTSKADNLNYFFTLNTGSDVIAIYDCDHYPHPNGPRWAIEKFLQDTKIDIVQGRCVIMNTTASFLAAMIAVEFDKIYAVSHPGRSTMWGFGLFCGSNGYWRTSLLRRLKMDGSMLTEDIDSALRAVSQGAKTVHDLNVVSYELAPTQWSAFWKQRLRWAQGWAQASLRHVVMSFNKPADGVRARDARTRFGLFSLLMIREWSYYLVTQYTCLMASMVITNFPKTPGQLGKLIFNPFPLSAWFFIVSVICLVATLWITARVKSEFVKVWMLIIFSILYPFYLVLSATIGLYGHARAITKYTAWNPTART